MNRLALVLVLVLGVAIGATLWMRSGSDLAEAERLMKDGNFERARTMLEKYVEANPDDSKAVQLLSVTMVNDESFGDERTSDEVVQVLDQIPDDAPEALLSRLQQAELCLLQLHEIQRAEDYSRRALAIAPDDYRCSEMMLLIFQLTRRFPVAEKYYDAMYRNAPANQRLDVLKKWYMSQFLPAVMNRRYDELIEIHDKKETDMMRFAGFMNIEPSAPSPRAAVAARYLDGGVGKEAVEILTAEQVDRSKADDFFDHQLIRAYIMMGKLEEAEAEFEAWSHDKDTHLYYHTAALIAEEVEADYDKAIEFYVKAMKPWPGPVDLGFKTRYVNCLKKAKNPEEAKKVQDEIQAGLDWLNPGLQADLRSALERLGNDQTAPDPDAIQKFADFYKLLKRDEDAERWENLLKKDQSPETAIPTAPTNTDF